MNKAIIFIIILISSAAYATIYVNQDKNGGIEYTDTPTNNSSRVEVPPVNSISTPAPAVASSPKTTANSTVSSEGAAPISTASSYQTFAIVSPANESTIQNQPVIPVEMKIEPNTLPGDKIQLMLDNKPAGTPMSTAYQELGIVDRGTHTLYAVILNSKNEVIKSTPAVTIHVLRNSIVPTPNRQTTNVN